MRDVCIAVSIGFIMGVLLSACDQIDDLSSALENFEIEIEFCELPPEFCLMDPEHFDEVFNFALNTMTEQEQSEWIYLIHNPPTFFIDDTGNDHRIRRGFVNE